MKLIGYKERMLSQQSGPSLIICSLVSTNTLLRWSEGAVFLVRKTLKREVLCQHLGKVGVLQI